MKDGQIRNATRDVVQRLVLGDYEGLARQTGRQRLSADQIRRAITEYGGHLQMPPARVFDMLDVIEIADSNPRAWSVRCDLWTQEAGRSDLSLELRLIESEGNLRVEIDGLHVL